MTKIELVQKIGYRVCEDCGSGSDCGIDPSECSRIIEAIELLDQYASRPGVEADAESRVNCDYCGINVYSYCPRCGKKCTA